jgi:hypothetical protein
MILSPAPEWDYDASVCEVRGLVSGWKSITVDIVGKLWEAREALNAQGRNQYTSIVPNGTIQRGWREYLEDIGLPKSTAHRWLSQYNPETRQLEERQAKPVPVDEAEEEEEPAPESEAQAETFIREPTGATMQARIYISTQLEVLKDDIDRHEFVNALLKYLKEKSIELGRGA